MANMSSLEVIGHTEGTAGIAGLMKASFAVQKGVIPPNLLFDKLSPRVAPFYKHLKIATEPTPWPVVAPGQPRRVSVNSFGKILPSTAFVFSYILVPPVPQTGAREHWKVARTTCT